MNRTIIVLFAITLSFVAAGCASKRLHREYSPLDEHDDSAYAVTDAEVGESPFGGGAEDLSADPTAECPEPAQPVAEPTAVATLEPKPEEDPVYRAELKRRKLEKQRREAARQANKELTGGN